ncbi:MAG: elongation factor P maturation arginine rhamnosyltransferase EarP [Burkholderiales bacterium]|nr:elongation factor P maturation arginine rhamnosyltransferase EarP [Burkholderiales bacterium]
MLWDIFCRVVDNFGDIGVCWRLSADLAVRGHHVRLWVDDASALAWMAPGALAGHWSGVQVLDWAASHNAEFVATLPLANVWVEGFGCEIAPEFIAACARPACANGINDLKNPVWINLEYLSAEAYVERCHGLPSPVLHGPAKGRVKYFFYPGFTPRTGGLLREPDLLQRQQTFTRTDQRSAWLQQHGIHWQGERLVSLFCYEPPALTALLHHLAQQPEPTRLLVTSGRATVAVHAAIAHKNSLEPSWNVRESLSFSYLSRLSQTDFDHLLWACDLNCVRGEDSLVRALWANKPLVWQIYPQHDNAHHDKLNAFLGLLQGDASLQQFHTVWNGLADPGAMLPSPLPHLTQWQQTVQRVRGRLLGMDDLAAGLNAFVQKKR